MDNFTSLCGVIFGKNAYTVNIWWIFQRSETVEILEKKLKYLAVHKDSQSVGSNNMDHRVENIESIINVFNHRFFWVTDSKLEKFVISSNHKFRKSYENMKNVDKKTPQYMLHHND